MGLAASLLLSFAIVAPAYAKMPGTGMGMHAGWGRSMMKPAVMGKVTAISGNTITVTDPRSTAVYTVDATNAKVTKNGTASTVSAIAVGDMVGIQGTISGTNVTATAIMDGFYRPKGGMMPASIIQGNGSPVVAGKVTAVSGNTLTITNNSNATYTVDATNAKIAKDNQVSTVSAIAVGDNLVVQGTFTGNSVAATSIIDQPAPASPGNSGNVNSQGKGPMTGFLGGIRNFFGHLFGF